MNGQEKVESVWPERDAVINIVQQYYLLPFFFFKRKFWLASLFFFKPSLLSHHSLSLTVRQHLCMQMRQRQTDNHKGTC